MTDQQRADTIRALGYDYMITPAMDRIAENGVSFRRCYACGATCIASRAAMFTGMYAHNTGVYTFNRWAHHRSLVHDLRDAGYHCVNIGKMHISPRDDPMGFHERVIVENPTNRSLRGTGVDDDWGRYLTIHGAERPNQRNFTDPEWLTKYQGVPWHLDEHLHSDVFIGNSALAWIDRYPAERDKPVFLQVGFTGPHEPYDPLPRILDLYDDVEMPAPVKREGELDEKPPQHRGHQRYFRHTHGEAQIAMAEATDEDIAEMRRHYYAKISTVDEKIGEVLDALEAKGYLENAVVIFTSDHGDMVGDHQMAYKWLMYESIVNIPLTIWDTRTEAQGVSEELVSHIDIAPTVLEAAGIEVPSYMEGESLMGYVNGQGREADPAVFCEDNYETMVRTDRYKLVHYTFQEDDGELYDLDEDPEELYNRFHDPAYGEAKGEMLAILRDWLARSTYRTAGYKNTQYEGPRHWPQESPYLLGGYRNNPKLKNAD
jgi:arylsulfatase A-like enzyme